MNRPRGVGSGLGPALAFLLPLWAWFPTVLDDARLDSGLLSLVVLGLAGAALLRRRTVAWLPGTGWFLGALTLGGAVLFLRGGPPPWWAGLPDRMPLLSAWLLACLAASAPGRRPWPWVFGGALLVSVYGLLQAACLDPLGWRPEPQSPPVAPLASTNAAGEVLAPILVGVVAFLPGPGRRPGPGATGARRLAWLAALPVAFHLGLLGLLAARISVPLGLGLALLRDRAKWLPAVAVLACGAAGELARPAAPGPSPEETAPAATPFATVQVRALMWQACLEQSLAAPWGLGLGRFEADYPEWRPAEELRLSSANWADPATPRPKTPHNEAALGLVETGWPGLLLLAVALWRLLRRPGRERWTSAPLLALGVHALVRSPLSDNPAALALAALLAGAGLPSGADPPAAPAPARTVKRFPVRALAGLALLAAIPAPLQVAGEWLTSRRFLREEPADRAAILEAALAWRAWDARTWTILAVDRSQAGGGPGAVRAALHQALRFDPANLKALTDLLVLEMAQGQVAAAVQALERAEAVAPFHPAVRANRTVWIRAQAAEQRRQVTADGAILPGNRPHLVAGNLLDALAVAREGDLEEARRQMQAAAFSAEETRALINRTARREDLDEDLVRRLLWRVLPDSVAPIGADTWEQVLGPRPAVPGPPATPE